MVPSLNWREIELLVSKLRPEVEGLFVDRIIIPGRERFPDGYLKGEWIIRLTGRKQEGVLLFSIQPRQPYLAWSVGKGPKASTRATHSPFDLSLSKNLKGAKLLEIQALPQERVVVLWFSEEGKPHHRLGLVLVFIPAAPQAYLVSVPHPTSLLSNWPIISRSRTIRDESKQENVYHPPQGFQAPTDPVVRHELLEETTSFYYQRIEKELQAVAFSTRLQLAQKSLRQLLKQARDRIQQSQNARKEAEKEENWQHLGDLLKASLGNPPELIHSCREVLDYNTGETVSIQCDPKLTLKEQVEKFYQNSRRKQRRLQEATSRMDRFQEVYSDLEKTLEEKPELLNWPLLEKIERKAGIQIAQLASANLPSQKKKAKVSAWLGKSFLSQDGLMIYVGRSKDENLELTFKHARGNDLWMHVRGRPGSHVVIPLQPGKSAPLETLLDAAHLVIYYSGGESWGKTEVDYTFKKYVKRIKDSTEASYTHNKTLLVQPDLQRTKKLLDQGS